MLRFDLNLVFTIINMLILYAIARHFLFKPVHKILEERQAEIDKQYGDAQKTEDAAKELKAQYEASMSGIEAQKAEVMNEARGKASAEYERIVAEARGQADKILKDAQAAADREQEKRMQQAQEQIADLVVAATAKMVAAKSSVEEDRELYNRFLARTESK